MKAIVVDGNAENIQPIVIGKQGEHEFTEVHLCFDTWLDEWPGCTVDAVYWRPDNAEFIIESGAKESPIIWKPTKAQLSERGHGVVELRLSCGETRGKSPAIPVIVKETPRESESEPESESPKAG